MEWWRDARFGLFIHWGLYSIPAGEWKGKTNYAEWIRNNAHIPLKVYDKFVHQFDPVKFNAGQWVKMAKNAGMKYIVITSKHHDGFCLFNSKYTKFDIMSTPFKRDVLKELTDAAHKAGIKIGFYYSIMDWHNPDYLPRRSWEKDRPTKGADFTRYIQYIKNQLHELLTNYGKISILWFDGNWERNWNNKYGREIYNYVRSLQPGIIINNRVGTGTDDSLKAPGDYETPEQYIPATGLPGVDWETCMTMNDHWGYNKHDNDWKPVKVLIRNLVDIASKGGNFLMNVGPTSRGVFPEPAVERLKAIGKWMKVNSESIYGTQASPFENLVWGRCTQRKIEGGTRLYLHVFDYPQNSQLVVHGIQNLPQRAFLLSDPDKNSLDIKRREDALVINLPKTAPDSINSVVVLDIKGNPDVYNSPVIEAVQDIFMDSLKVRVTSNLNNVDIRYTKDGSIPIITSPLVKGAITITKSSVITVRCFVNNQPVSTSSSKSFNKVKPEPAVKIENPKPGIHYKYYKGTWDELPDFDTVKIISSGVNNNFDITKNTKKEYFGYRFDGYVRIPSDGVYKFFTASDDGSNLYIDNKLVVDNDKLHSTQEKSGVIALAKGLHAIRVDYFQGSGGKNLKVFYKRTGIPKQIIPYSILFIK